MRVAHVGWFVLTLVSGCLRFGYDRFGAPTDAAQDDGDPAHEPDGALADAAPERDSAVDGSGGSAGAAAGTGGEAGHATGGAGVGAGGAGSSGTGPDADAGSDDDDDVMVGDGWWSQLPSRAGADAGEVEFRWTGASGTAIALDGRWRYGTTGDWLENWDVGLVTDRVAPAELTDRFDRPSEFIRHP